MTTKTETKIDFRIEKTHGTKCSDCRLTIVRGSRVRDYGNGYVTHPHCAAPAESVTTEPRIVSTTLPEHRCTPRQAEYITAHLRDHYSEPERLTAYEQEYEDEGN